jgi:hypothetical protein
VILIDTLRHYAECPMGRAWWCHMVSDTSLRELHEFAEELGLPQRAFQGDHYDLHAELRVRALEAGAVEVTSKVLVLRMVPPRRLKRVCIPL